MSTLTRRGLLLATAATALTASSSISLAVTPASEPFIPWQAEIDAVFEFFDKHHFTSYERRRALDVLPLHPTPGGDDVIRHVLAFKLKYSTHTQERIDRLLHINHVLQYHHVANLDQQRNHLDHTWSDNPRVSVRHLVTSGDLEDLRVALLCAKVRV